MIEYLYLERIEGVHLHWKYEYKFKKEVEMVDYGGYISET